LLQRASRLVAQPDVVEADDRRIGEGLEEGDLLVAEGVPLCPPNVYRADRRTLAQEWDAEYRPIAKLPSRGSGFGKLLRVGQDIAHVNGSPLEHATTTDATRYDPDKKAERNRDRAVVSGRPE